jgi:predicted tellurium resistance membrane protein TerC
MPATLTEILASLGALTFLEVVLGIDNIVFLEIAARRVAESKRDQARVWGLALAMVLRIGLLLGVVWLARLSHPFAVVFNRPVSARDVMLVVGGLFLMAKGASDIHEAMEPEEEEAGSFGGGGLSRAIVQIALINLIFSLDSVITAVGMTRFTLVMIAAVIISTFVMAFASKPVGDFIHHRPTTKMLALSFILLIGMALVADGLGFHIPRGYVYFAIAYALFVELLNILARHNAARLSKK